MSLERYGRRYGDHMLIGDNRDSFLNSSRLAQALALAWSDGCPIALRLCREQEQGGRGADVMVQRYGAVNFWGGMIKKTFNELRRTDLTRQFTQQKLRRSNEQMGTHDEAWIPEELEGRLLITPEGYSLPRIMIAYIEEGKTPQEKAQRVTNALTALEKSAQDGKTIKEVMIKVAQSLIKQGGNVITLLRNMLPQGKVDEDNVYTEYRETLRIIQKIAPELYKAYMSLSSEEKQKVGMANI